MEFFASYTGPDFLVFYGVLLVTAVLAALLIPTLLRAEGRSAALSDMEDIAVMAGGADRHTSVITADLLARGGLREDGKQKLTVRQQSLDAGPGGAAVLRKVGSFKLSEITRTLKSRAKKVEDQLIRRGMLMDQGDRWKLRLVSIAPFLLLLAIGAYRWRAGQAEGEPTGFLAALLGMTLIFAIIRFSKLNPRTKAGNDAIAKLRESSERLRSAPTAPEVGIAVAMFGTAVLVGTPFETVHAMRQTQGGDGGGDSGSDGDGGGGCGGGCGGCGG